MACTPLDRKKADEAEMMNSKKDDYFRVVEGDDEEFDEVLINRGEILIAYSDCTDCHKIENRSKGPSFFDIAKRYPYQQVYLNLLAQKIISGGSGSWGNPVMSAHQDLQIEDAKSMAAYILSLENSE